MTADAGGVAPAGASPHWLSTLLYVPLLLAAGWLLARPLTLLAPPLRPDQVDLAGLVVTLLLLLATLPWRIRRCWGHRHPWRQLGLAVPSTLAISSGLRGLAVAVLLLLLLTAGLLLSGQARWLGPVDGAVAANGLVLGLGVGFAEELLFRGWLWGELQLGGGGRRALLLQALIFALVHPWFRAPGLLALALLGGLALLGLALANERRLGAGSLWGAIGLHGGLVGGWFVVQHGLVAIAPQAPGWWVGPGSGDVNPIGGLSGLIALAALVIAQRTALARARRPSTGACNASSSGARP
ncbi:CPBP family intramembrane glutamic endopeptidase [Cyanobium sp. ATX 6A2]|uniref:CPBP family intramembrane glutamic endopeptidase n=1 Tax=Cyanobium sp. ATX 6A2 TaxID=2823700 RepID=UPI0020CEC09C|nr:CPBP family intramembrane glutamic endopeptidase [Cyanobium sp. ATX 6A2]